jgi:hypothetical protein
LVGGEQLDVREIRFEGFEEPGFARLGAGGTDGVTEQDDLALAFEEFAEVLAGDLAAQVIVRGGEADVLSVFRSESMITTGMPEPTGVLDRATSAWESSGARTMPLTRRLVKFSTTMIC